jgi:hypothetical protein
MPGRALAEHKDAAVVLYYAFSTLVSFNGMIAALESFKTGKAPGGIDALEVFLDYRAFAERARRYRS